MNYMCPGGIPIVVYDKDGSMKLIIPSRHIRITIIDEKVYKDDNGILDEYWNNRQLIGVKKDDIVFTISSYGLKIRHNTMKDLEYMIYTTSHPEIYYYYSTRGYKISRIASNNRVLLIPSTWKYHLYSDLLVKLLHEMTNVSAIISINDNKYSVKCYYNDTPPGYMKLYIQANTHFRSTKYSLVPNWSDKVIGYPPDLYGTNISCLSYNSYDEVVGLQYPLKSIFLSIVHAFTDISIHV